MKKNYSMKLYKLLGLSFLSTIAFSCTENGDIQPKELSNNLRSEISNNLITSIDSHRNNLLVEERFETVEPTDFINGDYSQFYKIQSQRTYGFDVSATKPARGVTGAKFELRRDDYVTEGVKRAEASSKRTTEEGLFSNVSNRHRWYGLSMYFPRERWGSLGHTEIITQFWSQYDNSTEAEFQPNPPIAVFVKNDSLYLTVRWNANKYQTTPLPKTDKKSFYLGPLEKSKWLHFAYNIKYSYQDDGLIQVWINGNEVLNYIGPNCYNDSLVPYFKFGVYLSGSSATIWDTNYPYRTLFVDEVRVGNENAVYNDVALIRK